MKKVISVLLVVSVVAIAGFSVYRKMTNTDDAIVSLDTKHLHPGLLVIVPLNKLPVFILNRRQSEINSLRNTYANSKQKVAGCNTCDPVLRSKVPEYLVIWGYSTVSGCELIYVSSTATDWVGHAVDGRGGFVDKCSNTEYDLSGRKISGPESSPGQLSVPRYSIHNGVIEIFDSRAPVLISNTAFSQML